MLRLALNVGRTAWHVVRNRTAKQSRHLGQQVRRTTKQIEKSTKDLRVQAVQGTLSVRDAGLGTHRGGVRLFRYVRRIRDRFTSRVRRDASVRWQLRTAARGTQPVIVGPWLSEVGFEALYWVPFLRWFCDRYRVDRSRLVVVSRGGVASWYGDVAERYIELLDLFPADQFAALNAARQGGGGQKQHIVAALDETILQRVRQQPGLTDATVCHPSAMFRLLRQFWLGNEALEYLQEHLLYAPVTPPPLPSTLALPERFVAVKFYTGAALPPTDANRDRLRALVSRIAGRIPVVALDTGLALDEHEDYLFRDIPDLISVADALTPQNNLGIQTAVIARAEAFVGTCGSLAWLAPMLGTPTLGVYADDGLLLPHLYAARSAYRAMNAAPFAAMDLQALDRLDPMWYYSESRI